MFSRLRLMVLIMAGLLTVAGAAPAGWRQPAPLFEFHSAFWVNLHHYLHALARGGGPLDEPLPDAATPRERAVWQAAVDEYRTRYGKRSLFMDEEMARTRLALREADSRASLEGSGVDSTLAAVLERAAPVYRRHRWPAHDAANRRFIAAVEPLLDRHGAAIARRVAASFDASWPAPVRVDLVHDAGPPGNAYTISEPTVITIAAGDPRHAGLAALELMFHEASHRWDERLMDEVRAAARSLDVRAPGGLWHGLLFFNAGTITAETLAASDIRDYVMYMDKQGMWDRAYRGWRPAITKHWPAFLAGEISRAEAVRRILRDGPER